MIRRRRMMITSSSDEDEEETQQPPPPPSSQQQQQNMINGTENDDVLLHQSPNEQVPISVSETSSPPPTGCPVRDFLLRKGLNLKAEWVNSCINGPTRNVGGGEDDQVVAAKAKLCFERLLSSDMNYCGAGVLPANVDSMHLVDLPGPYVLQVDEIVNISCPLKGRYNDMAAGVKRCLKLSMTDGVHRVFGMEYRPIKDLKLLAPVGFKVIIMNVHVRHGLLMLVPEAVQVLGGMVEELDAARQRLVNEVNKPPRGRRSRTREVPSLATRATQAAWPQNGVSAHGSTSIPDNDLGHINSSYSNVNGLRNSSSNAPRRSSSYPTAHTRASINVSDSANIHTRQAAASFLADNSCAQGIGPIPQRTDTDQRETEEFPVPMSAEMPTLNRSLSIASEIEGMQIDAPVSVEDAMSNVQSNNVSDHQDTHLADELEHPIILSGDREVPFTYMASLSAKWAATKERSTSVRGTIKCFLTGVKGFQYKHRPTYELRVYVDDGSLISEILVDHNVVQSGIGYSPEEVTAALSSSDKTRVNGMKETLKQFQSFLVNFEGTMLIEINGGSPHPVAIEMNQGCLPSDAWLLMKRLEPSVPMQTPPNPISDPIDVSP